MISDRYELIRLAGADRVALLQGQLTQDVTRLKESLSLPAAWCSPKGRVLVTCRLFDAGAAIIMAVPTGTRDFVVRRLILYRLRADVAIEPAADWRTVAVAGASRDRLEDAGLWPEAPGDVAASAGIVAVRHRGDQDYVELCAPGSALAAAGIGEADLLDDVAWPRERIAAGLVDIGTAAGDRYTPHMLNLDRVGAISFDKGCYSGQEVVARTEHLGRAKRRINRYRVDGHAAVVGDRLTAGGEELGEVVNAVPDQVLAVVPVERHAERLGIGTGTATPLPLPYTIS